MVGIVALAGYLLYSASGLQTLPDNRQSDDLKTLYQQVDSRVEAYTWKEATQTSPESIKQYQPLASNSLTIEGTAYSKIRESWDAQIGQNTVLRADPKLLAVYGFEGHGVSGLFAFLNSEGARNRELEALRSAAERAQDAAKDREREQLEAERGRGRQPSRGFFDSEGGGGFLDGEAENRRPVNISRPPAGVDLNGDETIQMLSAAVVLAKIPLPEQLQIYKNAFSNTASYDPSIDYPRYQGYFVERAEVLPSAELVWKPMAIRNGKDNRRLPFVTSKSIELSIYDWPPGLEEEFDPSYGHPTLTFPLPPLVGRNWEAMARHSEVPLASEMEEDRLDGEEDLLSGDIEENPDLLFDEGEDGGGGRDRFTRGGGEMGGGRGGFTRGGGEMGGGRGGFSGGFGGNESFDENGELQVKNPFIMLRYFDLSVQPGRKYKYRFKLIMQDPNYLQPKRALDSTVLNRTRAPRINGEWSEPTPTIAIPQAGVIRVAETKAATKRFGSEPTAMMLVESVSVDNQGYPRQAYKEIEARRGSVMDFQGPVEILVNQARYIEEVEDFTIDTGVTVLDLNGGEKYTRELTEPTQTLFMDASGNMYLRDELEDELEVAYHRAMFDKENAGGGGDFGGFEDDFGERG